MSPLSYEGSPGMILRPSTVRVTDDTSHLVHKYHVDPSKHYNQSVHVDSSCSGAVPKGAHKSRGGDESRAVRQTLHV